MELEFIITNLDVNMLVLLKMDIVKEKEVFIIKMDKSIKESFQRIKKMVKEFNIIGQQENVKGNLKMVNNKEKVYSIILKK